MWADDLLLKNAFGSRNAQAMSMLDAVKATGELTKRMWIKLRIFYGACVLATGLSIASHFHLGTPLGDAITLLRILGMVLELCFSSILIGFHRF